LSFDICLKRPFLNAFALVSHSIRANGTGKRKSEADGGKPDV
jgi:hypothetical protein